MSKTPVEIIDATLRDCGCCTPYDDVRAMILHRLEASGWRIIGPEANNVAREGAAMGRRVMGNINLALVEAVARAIVESGKQPTDGDRRVAARYIRAILAMREWERANEKLEDQGACQTPD